MKSAASTSLAATAAPPSAPRPSPAPRWALGLAIFGGILAALLPSSGHVHNGEHPAYAHHHPYAGAHSHSPASPEIPAPASPDRDSQIIALAVALCLDLEAPVLLPAAGTPLRLAAALPRPLPPGGEPAAPGSPRGPPAPLC